jgi:hypothetical protein
MSEKIPPTCHAPVVEFLNSIILIEEADTAIGPSELP